MDGCGCDRGFEIFDRRNADEDLARYRERGPDRTTALLLDMVRAAGVRGGTLLDIGGGIGVIDHELVRDGVGHATLVDASAPSLAAARDEARRRGQIDRLEFVDGDFVSRASSLDMADIVTLDRVICCYPDVTSLVRESASRARAMYALVLPRDRWLVRLGARLENLWFRLRGLGYRAYAHPNSLVDSLVSAQGLSVRSEARTFFWRIVLYDRNASTAPRATATV
jgi:predicted TPR repeat methyltransferase